MVKENYNGYYFGEVTMYCPWDVMNFCNNNYKKILNKTNQRILADNHWINSSSNDIIKEFMGFISTEAIDKMQQLVDGESIIATIKDSLCYGDLDSHSEDDFWTLLLYTGYLTINPNYKSDKKYEYELMSVSIHHGSVEGGHYIAKAKVNNEWKLFNDSSVKEGHGPHESDALVLFYKRKQKS